MLCSVQSAAQGWLKEKAVWTMWFCLGARVGRCGEKTAGNAARAGADQQGAVGSGDPQAQKWRDQGRPPGKQGAAAGND